MLENTKKRILVVHYSQTGQLDRVVKSIAAPLQASSLCELSYLNLVPVKPYPFPWPFFTFINAFPEAAHEKGCELVAIPKDLVRQYDLVIIGYQVWYLAPANPITAFLQSAEAEIILKDTPVITAIACRNMWLMAQEKVKKHLQRLQGKLIGNIALVDKAGAAMSFLATPIWVLSGSQGPYPLGIPNAGVNNEDIENSRRFGDAIVKRFEDQGALDETLLQGLNAVQVDVRLIATEKIATKSFFIWGKLFLLCGSPDKLPRKILALVYAAFLILMILTVVPINFLFKKLLAPFSKERDAKARRYFAAPSGE